MCTIPNTVKKFLWYKGSSSFQYRRKSLNHQNTFYQFVGLKNSFTWKYTLYSLVMKVIRIRIKKGIQILSQVHKNYLWSKTPQFWETDLLYQIFHDLAIPDRILFWLPLRLLRLPTWSVLDLAIETVEF